MTNSDSWRNSGAHSKTAGVAEMRAAKSRDEPARREAYVQRDAGDLDAEGRREGTFGKVVGCAGMEERGDEKCRIADAKKGI